MEPGDWKCVCGSINFKKRNNCRDCDKAKPLSLRPGDRICEKCNDIIFASRSSCRKCNPDSNNKPNIIQIEQKNFSVRAGDWYCSNEGCHELNFSSRLSCRKCHLIKPDGLSQNTSERSNSKNSVSLTADDKDTCVVCLDKPKTCVLLKCRHLCVCDTCGYALDKCPICRYPYNPDKDIMKVYNC
jgi:hypothetical protein